MVSGRGCRVFLKNLKCSGVPASLHGAFTVWERRVTSHDFPGLQQTLASVVCKGRSRKYLRPCGHLVSVNNYY